MIPSYRSTAESIMLIAEDLGLNLNAADMRILDFGCGSGQVVFVLQEMGFDVYGTDISNYWPEDKKSCFRKAESNPYRLPFEDNTFDFVISISVFEHVMNHEESFKEIYRVLKPGGVTLHLIPSRWYLPTEPHIYVPFASILQRKWWLALWAILGVRNEYQAGKTWREVVSLNMEFCKNGINYMSWKNIKKIVFSIFGNVTFAKKEYIKYAEGNAAKLGRKIHIPFYHDLVFMFREGALFMQKPVQ